MLKVVDDEVPILFGFEVGLLVWSVFGETKRMRASTGSLDFDIHLSEPEKCHHQDPTQCYRCPDAELSPMS